MGWGVIKYTLPSTQFSSLFFFIMSKQVLISLLAQGNTGAEILSILDALVADNVQQSEDNAPTLNPIEFWC